jgi:hypothetical protein
MIDGRRVGGASRWRPLDLDLGLPVGEVVVGVAAPGYQEQTRQIAALPNTWAQVDLQLEPIAKSEPAREASSAPSADATASLVVRSNVRDDIWLLDGEPVGPTGPEAHQVPVGLSHIRYESLDRSGRAQSFRRVANSAA